MNSSPTRPVDAVLSASGVVAELVATERGIAALQARQLVLLGRAGQIAAEQTVRIPLGLQREREMPLRSIAAELAAAIRRSDRGMQNRIHQATTLLDRYPAAVAALAAGRIDIGHLRVIEEAGAPLTDPVVWAVFEQAALAVAERETAGRAKPIILMLAHRLDPTPAAERHTTAAATRRVWVRDVEDGMAELVALLPAHLAHGIRDRLTRYARQLHDEALADAAAADRADAAAAGDADAGGAATTAVPETVGGPDTAGTPPVAVDTRTMDQRRADVFADLLLTGHATAADSDTTMCETDAIIAHIQVTVPAATLTGSDTPATFHGHGPLDPGTARHYASIATSWDRLFHHPTTGTLLGTDSYRPTAEQRRFLRGRDEHCRFPGCRAAAYRCDIDHTIDHAHGGPTHLCNLAHLCKRHHTLKHHTAWTVTQHPDGTLEWTSPTGRRYLDIPHGALEFTTTPATTRPRPPPPPPAAGRHHPSSHHAHPPTGTHPGRRADVRAGRVGRDAGRAGHPPRTAGRRARGQGQAGCRSSR